MREYYVGDSFVGMNHKELFEEGELEALIKRAGIEGFMPSLVKELKEEVIGIKNQKYDGYEFGREKGGGVDEVNFYFLIKKSQYDNAMNQIKYWSIAKGVDHLIRLDVRDAQKVAI